MYQLLLLSRKGEKSIIIEGICNCLVSLREKHSDSDCLKEFSPVFGTILLHMSFSMKHNQLLGLEFMKYVKPLKPLQIKPVHFEILFSMTRIFRFESSSLELCKSILINLLKFNQKIAINLWINEVIQVSPVDICKLIDEVVYDTTYGLDDIVAGMVGVLFHIIDIYSDKNPDYELILDEPDTKSIKSQAAAYSIHGIILLFQTHEMVRSEIINSLATRIVTQVDATNFCILLLTRIILKCPEGVIGYLGRLREVFESVSYLNHDYAIQMIRSFASLSKLNSSVNEMMLMILKKGLFSKDLNSRLNSVSGLFEILNALPKSSQIITDQNDQLSMEILSYLKRSLNQKYEVRELLYRNFEQYLEKNVEKSPIVLEIIDFHLRKYTNCDNHSSIKFQDCIHFDADGEPVPLEPFPGLFKIFLRCFDSISDASDAESSLSDFAELFEYIVSSLETLNIEALELQEEMELGNTNVAKRNAIVIDLLADTLEVLLANLLGQKISSDQVRRIDALLTTRARVYELSRDINKYRGNFHVDQSSSIEMIKQSLQITEDSVLYGLKDRLSEFSWSVCLEVMKRAKNESSSSHVTEICSLCYRELTEGDLNTPNEIYIIQIMHICFNILGSQNRRSRESSLKVIFNASSDLQCVIKICEFLDLLTGTDEEPKKEVFRLFTSVTDCLLSSYHTKESMQIPSQWLYDQIKSRELDNQQYLRSVLKLLVEYSRRFAHWKKLMAISKDISLHLGDYTKKKVTTVQPTFSLMSSNNAVLFCSHLVNAIDYGLDELDWALSLLKYEYKSVYALNKQSVQNLIDSLRHNIYGHVLSMSKIMSDMLLSPVESIAETIFKTLNKMFRFISNIIKYETSRVKNGAELEEYLEELIPGVSSVLTPMIYSFISYNQQLEMDNINDEILQVKKKSKLSKTSKSKVKQSKFTKSLPNLVYQIEQFERQIILLSKASNVNLSKYCKKSTARDFRISLNDLTNEELILEQPDENSSLN